MAPKPQEHRPTVVAPAPPKTGDEVVISGMSGAYPQSQNVMDLYEILYNKKQAITDNDGRWTFDHPDVPEFLGVIPNIWAFDAQFFKVYYKLGKIMDPMSRKILEQTYQAIYDAGVTPQYLSGKKVAVFIGSCFSEAEKAGFYVTNNRTGLGIAGCNKSMFANRISYWLNLKGPSHSIDSACSSTLVALERAYHAISSGVCEAAIVGGTNICFHPQSSFHYGRIITLCKDGKTKSFDKNADGCVRSDAINVLVLQKAKDANRIYAEVCHVKSEFAPLLDEKQKHMYGPYRDPLRVSRFLTNFYDDIGVSPSEVEYIEAFGSAVPKADKNELDAISKVFCKDRKEPLLVGSVMSNIGYTEAASGISSITKVLLAYHTGKIAANANYENPRDDVAAINDGRMEIVSEHKPFKRSYVGVNSFSVTGLNVHLLLKAHYVPKDLNRYKSNIPHLVLLSGRQDSAVEKIIENLKTRPVDPEEIALFHVNHENTISGHLGRGYCILSTDEENKTVSLAEKADYCDEGQKPLWFVYSGMGSQWAGMGTHLMRIPVFAAAIERCHKVLEPKGIDITTIITSPDKTMFDNILHSFVGIAAIQIGLTDVLREMGIVPDKIIGHSVGELGCAYADGCLTAEEMILSAYSRGLVSVQTPFIHGSMAAVGIGFEKIKSMCPPEIEVACHNSADSSTISGPSDKMREFVSQLTAKGIFAKEVPCSNIAYHSRYIKEAGPVLLEYLTEVIKDPKPRTDKWVSTSVPEDKWDQPAAQLCSAEYHTNNLLNPVLFEESSSKIPTNAVLIEIAPHGLLQAILKRSLSQTCVNIPLTRRGHPDSAVFLLEAIGKLYLEGYNPKISTLYPKVQFPVSTETPMLGHHIEWAHTEKWPLPLYMPAKRNVERSANFLISMHDDEHNYLVGNNVKNETLYPIGGVLKCVWDTVSMHEKTSRGSLSVKFENIHLLEQPRLLRDQVLNIYVDIFKGNGNFMVNADGIKIMTGNVQIMDVKEAGEPKPITDEEVSDSEMDITCNDVYKLLHDRGYYYSGMFRGIQGVDKNIEHAKVSWENNWVTFIESLIQMRTLTRSHDGISQPNFIRELKISMPQHEALETHSVVDCINDNLKNSVSCGGLTLRDVKFNDLNGTVQEPISLKTSKFVPFMQTKTTEPSEVIDVFLQMVLENMNKDSLNVIEISSYDNFTLEKEVRSAIENLQDVNINFEKVSLGQDLATNRQILRSADLVLVRNLKTTDKLCETLYKAISADIFIVTDEQAVSSSIPQSLVRAVASGHTANGPLVLARWRPSANPSGSIAVSVRSEADLALLHSTRDNLRPDQQLIVLSSYPQPQGLKELVQKLRRELEHNKVFVAMIDNANAQPEILEQLPNFDLVFNILDHGKWGGEYFVNCTEFSYGTEQNCRLTSGEYGDLKSLQWQETAEPASDSINVTVHYAGLNVRDALRATGKVPYKQEEHDMYNGGYGMDFSGITKNNERVMGVVPTGAVASRVAAEPSLLWPVPAHWSLEDAATVPLPYAQAFYLLGVKWELMPKSRVLVHGATGALGHALISIALAYDCQVFATVSDNKKKRFLRRLFPSLPEDHIGNSRDVTFADLVLHKTDNQGCNAVFWGSGKDLKNYAFKSCASQGIFLDISQIPYNQNYFFKMSNLMFERQYVRVDFSSLFTENRKEEMKAIQMMMYEGIRRGYVRPLSRVIYGAFEADRAFKLLVDSKHRGRALLHLQGTTLPATPRLATASDSSHLIVALENEDMLLSRMVDMLASRGAKNIFLHRSSSLPLDGYLQIKMKSWQEMGLRVELINTNLSTLSNVQNMITQCSDVGKLEGVYMITGSDQRNSAITSIIENIDTTTRNLAKELKYFVIIAEKAEIGKKLCVDRSKHGLPATMLNLSAIHKYEENSKDVPENSLSYVAAVEAVERAVRTGLPVIQAQKLTVPINKILLDIAAIAGIKITSNTQGQSTLEDLGLKPEIAFAVSNYLVNYKGEFAVEDIPSLTIDKIRELEDKALKLKNAQGLTGFFNFVDSDEILASHDVIFMPTLVQRNDLREDEYDPNQTFVVMVPGLDGHRSRFENFSRRLKAPAIVLQPGFDHPDETIPETAQRLLKSMVKSLNLQKKFYLLGHSFGVLVALELASYLEDLGLEGVVFCVDASPDTFPNWLEAWLNTNIGSEKSQRQDAIILHLYSIMAGTNISKLEQELKNCSSWDEKLVACVRSLAGQVQYSFQYAKTVIESAYSRIECALSYDGAKLRSKPLKSQIVVIKSEQTLAASADLGLSRYSQKPPRIYTIQEDHYDALDDLRSANIVNQNLDEEIHKAFGEKNLCESYLLNAFTYMAASTAIEG